jgi:hypothetical protein
MDDRRSAAQRNGVRTRNGRIAGRWACRRTPFVNGIAVVPILGALSSCGHSRTVTVPASDLRALVGDPGAYVRSRARAANWEPRDGSIRNLPFIVRYRARCSLVYAVPTGDCIQEVEGRLSDVQIHGGELRVAPTDGNTGSQWRIPLRAVESLEFALEVDEPGVWRKTWGVGGTVYGPAGGAAAHVQWLPAPWLGMEAGAFLYLSAFGYAGLKVRPRSFGNVVTPFIGAFVNGAQVSSGSSNAEGGTDSDGPIGYGGYGPRLGLDFEVHQYWTLAGEFDLVRPLRRDRMYLDGRQGEVLPWGGGSLSYFF